MSAIAARQGAPFRARRHQAVSIRSGEELRLRLAQRETEADFQAWVLRQAALFGWAVFSMHDSRKQHWGTAVGWPDLVLVRDGQFIAAELKSERGKLTAAQEIWLALLDQVPGILTRVWRPSNRPAIVHLLSRRSAS